MSLTSALDLPIARNLTGLLQLMQRLVGPGEHHHWCGGVIPVTKLPAFLHKMEQRYPFLRTTRERSYDRQRGRAVTHMIIYPIGHKISDQERISAVHELHAALVHGNATARDRNRLLRPSTISWWLVSSTGTGGLADPSMPDAHVARDAMHADGHITVGDYVLLYATKTFSSRAIERATYDSVAFRFIAGNEHPDIRCVSKHPNRCLASSNR